MSTDTYLLELTLRYATKEISTLRIPTEKAVIVASLVYLQQIRPGDLADTNKVRLSRHSEP